MTRLKLSETALRILFALAGGVCLGAAFPFPGVGGFAWVGPALMILSALGVQGGWQRFRLGYFAGMAHYMFSLHWLLYIPYRWMGLPLAPALGWVALSMFLSLFMGFWVWCVTGGPGASFNSSGESSTQVPFSQWLTGSWFRRTLWTVYAGAAWVAMEMVITRIFGGFPWNLLGASQYKITPLLQVAEFTGIYGVSFLVVWFAAALAALKLVATSNPQRRGSWAFELVLPAIAVAAVFNLGFRHITRNAATPARSISVALIQPSIPQDLIWDPANDDARFKQLLAMSEQALTNKPDLLIWPEAAVPKLLRYDEQVFRAVTNMAAAHRVWMIIGADDAEPRRNTPERNDADYFNSSFLISPEGTLVNRYKKRSLVIFGEYIPLVKWLPVFSWFTPIQGGFTAGDEPVPFRMPNLDLQTSVLICFEDIFPQLGRSASDLEIDFLVNITNDGWFGRSAAPWQHATSAVIRTIENRIPLIRCTNNGLTCWVDEFGRIREIQRDAQGTIYGESIGFCNVALPAQRTRLTFYTRYGDVFGWSCTALVAAVVFPGILQQKLRGRSAKAA